MDGSYSGPDCSTPPVDFTPDPDIAGLGVVIGYIGAAGIVVLILVAHFLLAFDPAIDPFESNSATQGQLAGTDFRPNRLDEFLLRHIRRSASEIFGLANSTNLPVNGGSPAILIMSVQLPNSALKKGCWMRWRKPLSKILSGLSILISGYAQLASGISTFHWQVIVSLTWFTSLTHFACLTILRSYLYLHPRERTLRLLAMGCIVIMLTVALLPTVYYPWSPDGVSYDDDDLRQYAICHFRFDDTSETTRQFDVGLSITLIIFAYFFRFVLLHKWTSRTVLSNCRRWASELSRSNLRKLWTKWSIQTKSDTARRRFVYHPILAAFLCIRILLDFTASMFLEVWWLVASYALGVLRIIHVLGEEIGTTKWTFGQVIPIVLLIAPFITIVESFSSSHEHRNKSEVTAAADMQSALSRISSVRARTNQSNASTIVATTSRVNSMEITMATPNTAADGVNDHPDNDFPTTSSMYGLTQLLVVITFAVHTIGLLFLYAENDTALAAVQNFAPDTVAIYDWPPLVIGLSFVHNVLWGFLIDSHAQPHSALTRSDQLIRFVVRPRTIARTLLFLAMLVGIVLNALQIIGGYGGIIIITASGLYWVLAVVIFLWRKFL